MEIYVKKFFYFHINLFFWFSNIILTDALILPISQLQTQQVMTSQIRSHIVYFRLITFFYSFCSQNVWKNSLIDGF